MKNRLNLFKIVIFTLVFITTSAFISGYPANESHSTCNDCNLAAPENLHATDIGPSHITMAWDQVQGAAGYEIQVIDAENNLLVNTFYSTSDQTSGTADNLLSGHAYRFLVAARCLAGGSWTTSSNKTISPDHITLIIELIAPGNAPVLAPPPASYTLCDNNNNGIIFECSYNIDDLGTVFGEIYSGNKFSRFCVYKDPVMPDQTDIMKATPAINNGNLFTQDDYYVDNSLSTQGQIFHYCRCEIINYGVLDRFQITVDYTTLQTVLITIKRVTTSQNVYGCRLKAVSSKNSQNKQLSMDAIDSQTNNELFVTNPINGNLTIRLAHKTSTKSEVYVINESGIIVDKKYLEANENGCNFDAAPYSKGIYFAVLKSEKECLVAKAIKL